MLGEAFSTVREEIRHSETGLAHPTFPRRFLTCTGNAGAKKSRPRRDRAVNSGQRSQRSPYGGFNLFFGRAGRLKP